MRIPTTVNACLASAWGMNSADKALDPNVKGPRVKTAALFCLMYRGSALGELEALTRFGLTVFLTFDHTAVAGQEACRFQRAAQRGIIKLKRF